MERDVPLKTYLSDNARYADLVNGFGFAGRQIVQADILSDLDTQTGIYQLPMLKKKKRKPKYRNI